MTRSVAPFGIRPEAMPAWISLGIALEDMEDRGQTVVCHQRPDQWTSDASEPDRKDAAEACGYCPARSACHAFALANREPAGVWGGHDLTPIPKTTRRAAVA